MCYTGVYEFYRLFRRAEGERGIHMKPTLVILAAGMGSRFGGLKQIEPVDDHGHAIIDFSVYDAMRAGFGRVLCVIKKEDEADFRAAVGDRMARYAPLEYAYQSLDDLPAGFSVPDGRTKPWGTAHALRACRHQLGEEPFAVINADDFYGAGAFRELVKFFESSRDDHEQCLVAYRLKNCLTENGTVSRGACGVSADGQLLSVTELLKIQGPPDAPSHSLDDGKTWLPLAADTPVSLNTWGFKHGFMDAVEEEFAAFLERVVPKNPLKSEFFLPSTVNARLQKGTDTARVVMTDEIWHGVTYRADLEPVRAAVRELVAQGVYPAGF